MVDRRARLIVPFVVLAGFLASCTSVPDAGPVHQGKAISLSNYDPADVRVLPPRPVADEEPLEIVLGFRLASADFDGSHAIAREYLTPRAAASWQPGIAAMVIDNAVQPQVTEIAPGVVRFQAPVLGEIGADGAYTPAAAGKDTIDDVYHLDKNAAGQWRISTPPKDVVLFQYEVQRTYRAANLYFLSPSQSTLVPAPVLLPVAREEMPTALAAALLRGPTSWLAPAVRTEFPAGTQLVSVISGADGAVTVNLTSQVLVLPQRQRQAMAAQLTWTLTQLSEVSTVRIFVDGTALDVSVPSANLNRTTWATYAPDESQTSRGYYVRDGHLVSVSGALAPGPAGTGELALSAPAIGPSVPAAIGSSAGLLAGLGIDAQTNQMVLYAGQIESPKAVRTASKFTAPSWDALGNLWTVQTDGSDQQVIMGPLGGSFAGVAAPELAENVVVLALRVSRDGTRVAAIVQDTTGSSRLLVGMVVTTPAGPRLKGFRVAAPGYDQVTAVAWKDSSTLVAINASAQGPQVIALQYDGYIVNRLPTLIGAVSIAAAPGQPTLAGTKDGVVYSLSGITWLPVANGAPGSDPFYPG